MARFSWASAGSGARYRVRQFLSGWRGWLRPSEISEVRARLDPAELHLFAGMMGRDQKHSYRVLRWIEASSRERGAEPSRALLVAALLHDVGKGRLATWQRVAFVLLNATSPRLARRCERERGPRWANALWRLRHHARLGAERAAAAGVDGRVVDLIARHTDAPGGPPGAPPVDDAELAWLVEADAHC